MRYCEVYRLTLASKIIWGAIRGGYKIKSYLHIGSLDIESDVIIPAGIASVVGYCVFCLFFGWGTLFDTPAFGVKNPLELGPYTVLAFALVLFGNLDDSQNR